MEISLSRILNDWVLRTPHAGKDFQNPCQRGLRKFVLVPILHVNCGKPMRNALPIIKQLVGHILDRFYQFKVVISLFYTPLNLHLTAKTEIPSDTILDKFRKILKCFILNKNLQIYECCTLKNLMIKINLK